MDAIRFRLSLESCAAGRQCRPVLCCARSPKREHASQFHAFIRACLLLLLFAGCGPSRPTGDLPDLHVVRGTVTGPSGPVSGGMVLLRATPYAAESNLSVSGEVDATGSFELHTLHALSQQKATGAPLGTYEVTYLPPGEDQSVMPEKLPETVLITPGENKLELKLSPRR